MKPIISEDKLLSLLPHGSGIDADWTVETHRNGNVTAYCSYHLMHEHGYYDGWQNFKVCVRRAKKDVCNPLKGPCEGKTQVLQRKGDTVVSVHLTGYRVGRNSANGLLDYLSELIGWSLESVSTDRHELIPTTPNHKTG